MTRRLPALLLLAPLAVWAAAPPPRQVEPWTADDVVRQEVVSGFRFSPDGDSVVWTKATADSKKNEHVSQVVRHDFRRGKTVNLTRGPEGAAAPRWSPDGGYLAFLTSRKAPKDEGDKGRAGRDDEEKDEPKTQVWIMDASGGEAWPLTDHPRGVNACEWADDDTVIFSAQEEKNRREKTLEDGKDTSAVVEDEANEPPVRLFKVDRESKKITRLSDNADRVESFAVSPDGKHAVAIHGRSLRYIYDNKVKPVVMLHDLAAGTRKRIFADDKLNVGTLQWTPDGKGVLATHDVSSKPQLSQAGVTRLMYRDAASGKESEVDLAWPRGLAAQDDNGGGPGVGPTADGFYAFLADGVRHRVVKYVGANGVYERRDVPGDHAGNVYGLAVAPKGGRVVYARSSASAPPRWYAAKATGDGLTSPTLLVATNAALDNKTFARTEIVKWKGANGDEIDGVLFYPHAHTPGKRAPLVLQIHGGPAAADHDAWDDNWAYPANLVASRGAFVLRPNYHGSTGYGLAFAESIAGGKYCEPEVEDIEKGVDALIAKGLVDSKRLASTGWSNGAILTNHLITRSARYKAAVAGAGSVEYVSDWSSCEFGEAFDRFYLGKSPLEDLDLYVRKSPFYRLDRVKTPTLLMFGTEDRVVHPQQGWAQYRAMQALGKAPVRFVQFPGEKHSLRKLSHKKRKVEEEMAWLDRHLFGKESADEVIVKDDSPLGRLLKRAKSARVGKFVGTMEDGALVPETVTFRGLRVGRFEVTRAQFAFYDKTRAVADGRENYPATGVTFEEARGYCEWLSKRTGRRYRLPTEAEAEKLYDKPGDGDNTLDAWAGYAVNADDARALRKRLEKLSPDDLLRPVGAGGGSGKDDMVFDLNGNAAEWVSGKDGKGVARGGSADTPGESRGRVQESGRNFHGFRILVD